jgi:hypothetical protein
LINEQQPCSLKAQVTGTTVSSETRQEQQRLVEDRLWELIEPLLAPRPVPEGPGGRP